MSAEAPKVGDVNVSVMRAVPCTSCDDEGLVDDENWTPDYYPQERTYRNGLLDCGYCDGTKVKWHYDEEADEIALAAVLAHDASVATLGELADAPVSVVGVEE